MPIMLDATRENLAAAPGAPEHELNGHATDDWDALLGGEESDQLSAVSDQPEEEAEAEEEIIAEADAPVPDGDLGDDTGLPNADADDALKPGEIALTGVRHEEDEEAIDENTHWTIAGNPADVDWREKVQAAQLELKNAEDELLSLKEEAKVAKKAAEVALDRLKRIIDRGPEQLPLFDKEKTEEEKEAHAKAQSREEDAEEEEMVEAPAAAEAACDEPADSSAADCRLSAADSSPDAWRSVTVEALGLPQGICDCLREGGLPTLGELADYTASGATLTLVKGIGPGKAGKIEEACEAYWAANQGEGVA